MAEKCLFLHKKRIKPALLHAPRLPCVPESAPFGAGSLLFGGCFRDFAIAKNPSPQQPFLFCTAKSKERSEHTGSTRKLIRQKGSGGARRGDINSPVLVGGGRVFGPKPRNYGFKLNKKVKQLARKSVLTYKAQEDAIIVLEDFSMEAPKTKEFINIVKNLKVDDKKVLLALPEVNKNVYLSARNLKKAEVMLASTLNTYKVLNADVLVVTEKSLEAIDGILK